MNDVILLLSAFGVMGYLVGIGKIIGNAIKIGFNSAHNNSNRTTAIYFLCKCNYLKQCGFDSISCLY